MKTNTNSNTYIIIYSAVLVVIVAFLLAFISLSLKSKQDAGLDGEKAEAKYAEVVKKTEAVDDAFIYVCEVDGKTKYVIPLKGMGLWGAIRGYISINDDANTVFGAYFDHDGETAGLGAEIKDSQAWQEKFQGKK